MLSLWLLKLRHLRAIALYLPFAYFFSLRLLCHAEAEIDSPKASQESGGSSCRRRRPYADTGLLLRLFAPDLRYQPILHSCVDFGFYIPAESAGIRPGPTANT